MSRSMVLAILAFSLLILANLATFGILSFRTLSERMVTEKLWTGLSEAQSLLMEDTRNSLEDPTKMSRRLAPRLRTSTVFQAVVVLDAEGNVVHREVIGRQLITLEGGQPGNSMESLANNREPARGGYNNVAGNLRHLPVQTPGDTANRRLALEYNEETVRKEVEELRSEFNRKMAVAIGISLLLLFTGLGFVLSAYKRSKIAQEEVRRADRMAYVGTLSSGLAHEIRNPLNSMNMNVQLIQEELEEMGSEEHEDILEMLESTRGEVHRLERLVSSFLAYARPTQLSRKPIQINDLVSDILTFLSAESREKGVDVNFQGSEGLPLVLLDENLMRQALLNVIQNAIQVLQKDQKLTISTRKAGGDKVLVVVKDEGPGIAAEELKNIFKEFYSTKRGGTGLGLPIAMRIAELHMGGIKVESEIGTGTTFTFILPMEQNGK